MLQAPEDDDEALHSCWGGDVANIREQQASEDALRLMRNQLAALRGNAQLLNGRLERQAADHEAQTDACQTIITQTHQITQLSRRNTNVRSLALSLTDKRNVAAACEKSLHELRNALAKRSLTGMR